MNPYEELDPDVAHRAFLRQPAWKRIVVIAAGPAVNLLVFFVLVFGLLWHQGQAHGSFSVSSIERKTPAAQQLRLGDRILSVDGAPGCADPAERQGSSMRELPRSPRRWPSTRASRRGRLGCVATTPARVVVLREGERKTLLIKPHYGNGGDGRRMLLGIGWDNWIAVDRPRQGRVGDPEHRLGRDEADRVADRRHLHVGAGPQAAFERRRRLREITREQFEDDGFATALGTLALISLSLALINLFPFLPLDGGHIVWAIAEKIRGRPIPFRVIERASAVGFVLIAFVFIIGLSNDIGHLTGVGLRRAKSVARAPVWRIVPRQRAQRWRGPNSVIEEGAEARPRAAVPHPSK